MTTPSFALDELSQAVEGMLLDPSHGSIRIHRVAPLDCVDADSITFVESPPLLEQALATPCAAIVVPAGTTSVQRPAIAVRNPRLAFARMLRLFHPIPDAAGGIHPTAVIGQGTEVDPTATVGAWTVLEDGVVVGAGTRIQAHCHIGAASVIGPRCWIHPGVRIGAAVRTGSGVILHCGCVLGDRVPAPVRGKFSVTVGNDVEIGARTRIEGGSRAATVIGDGTKCDNLVFIGAGAEVGRACILVAQTCLEPESILEDGCVIAAQGMVLRGQRVGSRSIVAARSVAAGKIPPEMVVSGAPARPHREELRGAAAVHKMGGLYGRLLALENRL